MAWASVHSYQTQTAVRIHFVFVPSTAAVYKYQLGTIIQLKAVIRQEIATIKPDLIHRMMQQV